MHSQRIMTQTLLFVLTWVALFSLLNVVKWRVAVEASQVEASQLESLELFTLSDALISAVPLLVWLVVSVPWEKISVGPLTFERRMRRRIEDQLDPQSITPVEAVELSQSNAERIRNPGTKAVNVKVGDEHNRSRYNDLLWFIAKSDDEENIDWRHVDYLAFSDLNGKLIGTMSPNRFRQKLRNETEQFLDALRTNKRSDFLEYGDGVHVKETDTKSKVLAVFAKHPLRWFPVINESKELVGIVEPRRLAVALIADIAAVLSDN